MDGGVQSLALVENGNVLLSIGMVEVGDWHFTTATSTERISVTLGALRINGKLYSTCSGPAIIPPGEDVEITVKLTAATYICIYDPPLPLQE